uniref:Uncharacterized protein n=1 Tax=Lotharella oceanica TaxID=641309 RepID=A0A7S2X6N0_9EUKA|mmetsp:Transcript_1462/g.2765  ORF Transcript_1462/g.2765 Transcript_1462/m.2765 type:complete len:341 (+) Transcript_1462:97-1119(+)
MARNPPSATAGYGAPRLPRQLVISTILATAFLSTMYHTTNPTRAVPVYRVQSSFQLPENMLNNRGAEDDGGGLSTDTEERKQRAQREELIEQIKMNAADPVRKRQIAEMNKGVKNPIDPDAFMLNALNEMKSFDSLTTKWNFSEMRMGKDEKTEWDYVYEEFQPERDRLRNETKLALFEMRYEREKKIASGEIDLLNETIGEDTLQVKRTMDESADSDEYEFLSDKMDPFEGLDEKTVEKLGITDATFRENYVPWLTEERFLKEAQPLINVFNAVEKAAKKMNISGPSPHGEHPLLPGMRDPEEWYGKDEESSKTDDFVEDDAEEEEPLADDGAFAGLPA